MGVFQKLKNNGKIIPNNLGNNILSIYKGGKRKQTKKKNKMNKKNKTNKRKLKTTS